MLTHPLPRRPPKDGIVSFDALVDQFMSQPPYDKAQRVFVIVIVIVIVIVDTA